MEVAVWTTLFVGGDLLILIFLLMWAVKKDREKTRAGSGDEQQSA